MAETRRFVGERTIDGVKVTVEGREIDPRLDVRTYTDHGFEWSYEGDGPRQLALAILAEHMGDAQASLEYVEPFMQRVVANFDNDWEMTSADIDRALENIRVAA
jgi:hypothetical protein